MNFIHIRICAVVLVAVMFCVCPVEYVCADEMKQKSATIAAGMAKDTAMSVKERAFVEQYLAELSSQYDEIKQSPFLVEAVAAYLVYGYRDDRGPRARFELQQLLETLTDYAPEEKAFLIREAMREGGEPFVMTRHDLGNIEDCSNEITAAFVARAQAEGLSLDGFDMVLFDDVIFLIVENLWQHEYREEESAYVIYRIVRVGDGLAIEWLGCGKSPLPEKYIVPGTRYDAQHRPWAGDGAPEDAYSGGRDHVGVGNMFSSFAEIDEQYGSVSGALPVGPVSIVWDHNRVRDFVPGAVGAGHSITLTVPLRAQRLTSVIAGREAPNTTVTKRSRISSMLVWGAILAKIGIAGVVAMRWYPVNDRLYGEGLGSVPNDATIVAKSPVSPAVGKRVVDYQRLTDSVFARFSDEMTIVHDSLFNPIRFEVKNLHDYYAARTLSWQRQAYYEAYPEVERDATQLRWFDVADRTVAYYSENGGAMAIALMDAQQQLSQVPATRVQVGANSFYRMPDEEMLADVAEKAVPLPDVNRYDPTIETSMDSLRQVFRTALKENKGTMREKFLSEELAYVMAALVNEVSSKTGISAVVLPNELLTGALGKSEDHFRMEYFNILRHSAIIPGRTVFAEAHLDAGRGIFAAAEYPKLLLFEPNEYGQAHWSRWLDYENTAIVEIMGLQTLIDTPAEKALIQWARHVETVLKGMKERYPDMKMVAFIGGHGGRKTSGYFMSARGTEARGASVNNVRDARFLKGDIDYVKVRRILQDMPAWPDVAAESAVFIQSA